MHLLLPQSFGQTCVEWWALRKLHVRSFDFSRGNIFWGMILPRLTVLPRRGLVFRIFLYVFEFNSMLDRYLWRWTVYRVRIFSWMEVSRSWISFFRRIPIFKQSSPQGFCWNCTVQVRRITELLQRTGELCGLWYHSIYGGFVEYLRESGGNGQLAFLKSDSVSGDGWMKIKMKKLWSLMPGTFREMGKCFDLNLC